MFDRLVTAAAIVIALAGVAACQREGPAERAGKQIDQAVEKAGDKVERAGEKIQDTAKDAKK